MAVIEELTAARERMRESFHNVGEPVVRLDPKKIGIAKDDPSLIYISVKDFIKIAEQILEY